MRPPHTMQKLPDEIGPQTDNVRLFSYETEGGINGQFWRNPHLFSSVPRALGHMLDHKFRAWANLKRPFTSDEVLVGQWIKISDTGNSSLIQFHADGTLLERPLFDDKLSWRGEWRIADAYLWMKIGEYKLHAVANRSGFIHSAVEFGLNNWQVYFKLVHFQQM